MVRKIIVGFVVVLVGSIIFFSYLTYRFVDELGECGMSAGPCFGRPIDLDLKKAKVDQYLDCPNGRIGFISTQDTLTPIVFKLDLNTKLLWAFRLESDSCSGIPLKKMTGMEILEDKGLKRIHFFNETYYEPGIIYLTDEYNFSYLCLSPM